MKKLFILLGGLLLILQAHGQTLTMTNGSTSTCSGTFYDSGGAGGTYSNNQSLIYTICSNAGNCVRVNFSSFDLESGWDYLTIYDGPNTSSPIIGNYTGLTSPGTVTSTSGCLTFWFTSDGSVTNSGWAATVSCAACSGGGGGCLPNMGNCSDVACSGNFYDPGGVSGSYGNNASFTHTICSSTPGNCLSVNFTSFSTESGFDFLTIYDGPNTSSPVIGTYSGSTSPGSVTSTTGCLTFRFTSDGSVTGTGWAASITCAPCGGGGGCLPNMGNCVDNACSGNFYDPGGVGGNYANNSTFTHTICSNSGNCLRVNFSQFDLETGFDFLRIYDGSSTATTLIGSYTGTTLPGTITSSTGCLTFQFTSDISTTRPGWQATISCVTCPTLTSCLINPVSNGHGFPSGFTQSCDDLCSSSLIPLNFTYNICGNGFNSTYVNMNGNVTFGTSYTPFTSSGFPNNSTAVMVAPFWADVDTRSCGTVYFQNNPTNCIVTWYNVGYYSSQCDKLNTFQLILTDGNDPLIGVGNNTAFYFGNMAWTTGSASSGVGGFGGTPATTGINANDGINYSAIGRFDHAGITYDGPAGSNDGVDYLDNRCFTFPAAGCAILPVNMLRIHAEPVNNAFIALTWSTNSEYGSEGFALERSEDGQLFEKIGHITQPISLDPNMRDYAYDDRNVVRNKRYFYRLRQRGNDGSEFVSDIVEAIIEDDPQPIIGAVHPNPFMTEVSLDLETSIEEEFQFRWINQLGQVIAVREVSLTKGHHTLLFDTESFAKGMYYLEVRNRSRQLSVQKTVKN